MQTRAAELCDEAVRDAIVYERALVAERCVAQTVVKDMCTRTKKGDTVFEWAVKRVVRNALDRSVSAVSVEEGDVDEKVGEEIDRTAARVAHDIVVAGRTRERGEGVCGVCIGGTSAGCGVCGVRKQEDERGERSVEDEVDTDEYLLAYSLAKRAVEERAAQTLRGALVERFAPGTQREIRTLRPMLCAGRRERYEKVERVLRTRW